MVMDWDPWAFERMERVKMAAYILKYGPYNPRSIKMAARLVASHMREERLNPNCWSVTDVPVAGSSPYFDYPIAITVSEVDSFRMFNLGLNGDGEIGAIWCDDFCEAKCESIAEAISRSPVEVSTGFLGDE